MTHSVLNILGGFNFIITNGVLAIENPTNPAFTIKPGEDGLTNSQRLLAVTNGIYFAYIFPLLCAWYLTLKLASALVSDAVVGCRTMMINTLPTDDEWDDEVVPSVLKLIDSTLPTLSKGWSDSLLAMWMGCWAVALSSFALFLDTNAEVSLFLACFCLVSPILLAYDVASASSDCDKLKSTLNVIRARDMSVETDLKLQVMERLLQNTNNGAGLGFIVGNGKVLDMNTLKSIFAGMFGFLATVLPLFLALRYVPASRTHACDLSDTQITRIKAAMLGSNDTCSFNQTINDVLA